MNRNVEDEATAGSAARERCSEATLHGTYLAAYDGVVTEGPDQGPFAAAELVWFDGRGNTKAVNSTNLNGTITSDTYHGEYTVKADCTATVTYPDGEPFQYDLFIAPDGSRFTFVQTNPPQYVVSGVEQRVTRKQIGD